MACVMFARLEACSARGRGGGATSWATRGMTCGAAPVDTGSHRHIHGTAASSCSCLLYTSDAADDM
eukprot:3952624-Alexandrium_andersonii.AAC.1